MLETLKLERFRGFDEFELNNLGRLNLLVGTNNSGKTSILEAIRILHSKMNASVLEEIMQARGEYFDDDQKQRMLDIRHLFYGRDFSPGQSFVITGLEADFKDGNGLSRFSGSIFLGQDPVQLSLVDFNDDAISPGFYIYFQAEWVRANPALIPTFKDMTPWRRPLSPEGGLYVSHSPVFRSSRDSERDGETKVSFVSSSALSAKEMVGLFNQIVLEPEEELVNQAMKIIDPDIERVATVSSGKDRSSARAGFVVRLAGSQKRVPIGSMGDGIWRMLGLALAAAGASGGILLVDEIDTGLHFTAMSDMWRLVWETAKEFDIQVFATTHNSDCWSSLASIAANKEAEEEGITIQRIEKGKDRAVVFSAEEIVIAADRGIEVR